jgi:hypothetical protein
MTCSFDIGPCLRPKDFVGGSADHTQALVCDHDVVALFHELSSHSTILVVEKVEEVLYRWLNPYMVFCCQEEAVLLSPSRFGRK